jgi:hypothetical protein
MDDGTVAERYADENGDVPPAPLPPLNMPAMLFVEPAAPVPAAGMYACD